MPQDTRATLRARNGGSGIPDRRVPFFEDFSVPASVTRNQLGW